MVNKTVSFTQKICDLICHHDSSEITARMLNFFVYILPQVVKRHRFFKAFYFSHVHVYSIELKFDVNYRSS